MNQYLELLNKTIICQMANDINKKLHDENKEKIEATPESVFENLHMLYDTFEEKAFGEPTGNSYRYMPKRYKAMVMRLIAPEYYPEVKITYVCDDDKNPIGVCAEARLYLNNDASRPVAFGKQYLSYNSVSEQIEDEREKRAYAESTVRGIALSKAYQEFGIGAWYTYTFEPEENPDAALAGMNSHDGISPTIPIIAYGDNNTQASDSIEDVDAKTSQNAAIAETVPNIPEKAVPSADSKANADKDTKNKTAAKKVGKTSTGGKATKTSAENSSTENNSALEKARAMMAPIGKAADLNLTLGETEERYPLNILWMYMQTSISGEVKDSLKLIALNNIKILNAFKEKGVPLN